MTAWPIPPRLDDVFSSDHPKADRATELLWAHLLSEHSHYMSLQMTTVREMYDAHAEFHRNDERHADDDLSYDLGDIGLHWDTEIERLRVENNKLRGDVAYLQGFKHQIDLEFDGVIYDD